jgi:cellulose synthase/poly-beta-1,6-N-acetylglucosamine synthase-like glycosyltransferase
MNNISIFILIVIILLTIFYVYFLNRIVKGLNVLINQKTSKTDDVSKKISVIIPFRDESRNIVRCLESLQNQTYDKDCYEVIFVNDFSQDDSVLKLQQIIKDKNFKLLSIPGKMKLISSKKTAINYGINNSIGEIIVTTDADCIHETEWLNTLAKHFTSDTGIVAGPVQFDEDQTLFQKIQNLEFQSLILIGAGLIGIGKPIICNAANFSFRKKLFLKLNGYDNDIRISSGDDVLFMQRAAAETNYKVKFCFDEKCMVKTKSNNNMKEFFQQRKRWAGKIFLFHNKAFVIELILVFIFYLSIFTQIILGFFVSSLFFFTLFISCLVKILSELSVLLKGSEILKQKFSLFTFLLAEILHLPYLILSVFGGLFGSYSWKGRKVVNSVDV